MILRLSNSYSSIIESSAAVQEAMNTSLYLNLRTEEAIIGYSLLNTRLKTVKDVKSIWIGYFSSLIENSK